jgi:hypothetical protein
MNKNLLDSIPIKNFSSDLLTDQNTALQSLSENPSYTCASFYKNIKKFSVKDNALEYHITRSGDLLHYFKLNTDLKNIVSVYVNYIYITKDMIDNPDLDLFNKSAPENLYTKTQIYPSWDEKFYFRSDGCPIKFDCSTIVSTTINYNSDFDISEIKEKGIDVCQILVQQHLLNTTITKPQIRSWAVDCF